MSNTTTLDGLFKRNYDTGSQVFTEQQNLKTYTWNKIKVSPLKPTPQGVYLPVNMRGNEDGSAINESEGFQDPGSFTPVQARVRCKRVVWPFKITGTAIELSESNKQAFMASVDAQQKDNFSRMMSDLNRQCLGKETGQISLVNVAGGLINSTALVVDNARLFRAGMKIDVFASIGGAKQIDGVSISAVTYSTNTLTLASNQSCDDNAIVVKKGVLDGVGSGYKELVGLQRICDTTTYGATFEDIAVASYSEWQGNVVDAGVAPVSQDLLQQTADRNTVVGGSKADFMISNTGQARTFLNTELQRTRFEPTKVLGGHTILKWNDMEWLIDKDYDLNEVGMYNMEYVQKYQSRDPHLAQHDGKILQRIGGFDMVAGYYVYYGDIGSWKRNAHARLINLTEPTF